MFCSKECASIGHRFHRFECDIDLDLKQDSCIFQMCHRAVFEAIGIFGDITKLKEFLENNTEIKTIFDIGDISKMNSEELTKNLLIVMKNLQKNPIPLELLKPMTDHCKIIMSITECKILKEFLQSFMQSQMSLIITNSFGLTVNHEEYGAGIFPFASNFNHSCAPNVFRISLNGKLVFIVIRPIQKTEQLYICYRENFFYKSISKRKTELYHSYNFKCNCEACIQDYPKLNKLPKLDKNLVISVSKLQSCEDIIAEYRKNCHYINKNHLKYPSFEMCMLIERNYELLNYIVSQDTFLINV